ncbi:unnamed protein product, partial [Didymodactylos carnosus]
MDNSRLVTEGKANIQLPNGEVFYNPAQVFNRDLSVAVLRLVSKIHYENVQKRILKENLKNNDSLPEQHNDLSTPSTESSTTIDQFSLGICHENGLRIAEALSATGLRSIRYALEIPFIKTIYANDLSLDAYNIIKKNIETNHVEHLVQAYHDDASSLLYNNRKNQFDIIDLDPYGTPAPFLDAAVQAIQSNGVLCITATDMASLCGNAPQSCYSKYGSISLHEAFGHEFALRMLLYTLHMQASRYNRSIEPLICMSIDFYIRLFVRIKHGVAKSQAQLNQIAHVYNCVYCGSFHFQPWGISSTDTNGNVKFKQANGPPVGTKCEQCDS